MESKKHVTSFKERLQAEKGSLEYNPEQAFGLHVFWVVPNEEAVENMLQGLSECSVATARDTPCTSTYFFRVNRGHPYVTMARERFGGSCKLRDHPQFVKYFKLKDMGLGEEALKQKLKLDGFNVDIIDMGDDYTVGEACAAGLISFAPILLECSEVYLDTDAFWTHAMSKDYLAAYGKIIQPCNSVLPTTYAFGCPEAIIVERVLEPVLKAPLLPMLPGSSLFEKPTIDSTATCDDGSIFLAIDAQTGSLEETEAVSGLFSATVAAVHRLIFTYPMDLFEKRSEIDTGKHDAITYPCYCRFQIAMSLIGDCPLIDSGARNRWTESFKPMDIKTLQLHVFGEVQKSSIELFTSEVFPGTACHIVFVDDKHVASLPGECAGYPIHRDVSKLQVKSKEE